MLGAPLQGESGTSVGKRLPRGDSSLPHGAVEYDR